MSEVILSESQNFLFGFISNLGQRIMGMVPLYAGRALLVTFGELCNPLLHVLSLYVYTMVIESFFSLSLPPSHFFPSKILVFLNSLRTSNGCSQGDPRRAQLQCWSSGGTDPMFHSFPSQSTQRATILFMGALSEFG